MMTGRIAFANVSLALILLLTSACARTAALAPTPACDAPLARVRTMTVRDSARLVYVTRPTHLRRQITQGVDLEGYEWTDGRSTLWVFHLRPDADALGPLINDPQIEDRQSCSVMLGARQAREFRFRSGRQYGVAIELLDPVAERRVLVQFETPSLHALHEGIQFLRDVRVKGDP